MAGTGIDLNLAFDIHMFSQGEEYCEDSRESREEVAIEQSVEVVIIDDPVEIDTNSTDSITGMAVPSVGMEFVSKDAAYEFYLRYAFSMGFGIMKNGGGSKNGSTQRFIMTCDKSGKSHGLTIKPVNERNRLRTKTGCLAAITLKLDYSRNIWIVTQVVADHNHDLCPKFSHKIKCFRHIKDYAKKQLEINENAGVPIIGNINAVTQMGGGEDYCGFTERDCRNFLAKLRRCSFQKGDAEELMKYFRQAKLKDPNFYYSCKFDEENRLEVIFWSDSASRSWYKYFGDVVTFDATYIVNRYDLPVAPIVGVNHHGQSIIFGYSMMTFEDADTYRWIINAWLECMGGKAPKCIITDQSMAMKNAIDDTLPNTIHRYCIWHILNKLDTKIGNKPQAGSAIRKVIYDSTTEDEFEGIWRSTISEYCLEDNVWFRSMFEIRKSWVPVYLNKHFWAGMSSTQRSESINAFLDKFVNSKTSLRVFVKSFELALARLRKRELDEDYECIRGCPRLISEYNPIEQQFSAVYTNKMFIKFQDELLGLINSKFTFSEQLGHIRVYMVDDGHKEYKVNFNSEDHTFSCECHLFETKGLVCRHALLVYKQEGEKNVPSKYILDRWSKDFKRNHLDAKAIAVRVKERRERQNNLYSSLHPIFLNLIDYAVLDEDTQKAVVDGLNGLMISISKSRERMTESVGNTGSNVTAESSANVVDVNGDVNGDEIEGVVKDPIKRRKRGRNSTKRLKSFVEVFCAR